MAWESSGEEPKSLSLYTYVGDPEVPDSQIWIDSALAVVDIWGVKQ